jgi:hypothetical protein
MLLAVIARLCEELAPSWPREATNGPGLVAPSGRRLAIANDLTPEDERLVADLRAALGRLVLTLEPNPGERARNGALATLDAAESVMGIELLQGRLERLPRIMPSFVFLLTLQVAAQDRAIELSERAAELIEEEQRAGPDF